MTGHEHRQVCHGDAHEHALGDQAGFSYERPKGKNHCVNAHDSLTAQTRRELTWAAR